MGAVNEGEQEAWCRGTGIRGLRELEGKKKAGVPLQSGLRQKDAKTNWGGDIPIKTLVWEKESKEVKKKKKEKWPSGQS